MKILIIDNYDSFTYNLVQLIGEFTPDIEIRRNDTVSLEDIREMQVNRIVISPGPGRPEEANISLPLIGELGPQIPVLGVCLGHQAIGMAFGAKICHAPTLMHGKVSQIRHDQQGIYQNMSQNFTAGRYHSLVIDRNTLPAVLQINAQTADGIIMGVRHTDYPIVGIQFHPESVLTEQGVVLIKNWLEMYHD
jgi:anthranilate synthase/aminodeoxychorismate synthase-like glutamine amidotransferase